MFLNEAWSSINKQTNKKRLHDFSIQGLIEQRKNENCNATGDHNPLTSNLGVTKNILSFDCSLIVAKC